MKKIISTVVMIGISLITISEEANTMFRGNMQRNGLYNSKKIEQKPKEVWSFKIDGKIRSTPVIYKEYVIFGSIEGQKNEKGKIYAVDIKDGKEKWQFDSQKPILSSPLINNGIIYIEGNGVLFAINGDNGQILWKYDAEVKRKLKTRGDEWDYFNASPIVYNDNVYYCTDDGRVIGLNCVTGEERFSFKAKTNSAIHTSSVISKEILFFGNWAGHIYAVDLKSGKEKWVFKSKGTIQSSSLSVWKNTIVFGSRDCNTYAIDEETGELKWKVEDSTGSWISSSAATIDNTVVIGGSDNNELSAYNIDNGELKWKFKDIRKRNFFSSPIISDGIVYAAAGDVYNEAGNGTVFAVDITNGKLIWEYDNQASIFSTPVISESGLIFTDESGNIKLIN